MDVALAIISFIVGFLVGGNLYSKANKEDFALKLSNIMNSSMLDLVTHRIITKEQVHDIETVFHKHIEENFEYLKASHGVGE